MQAGNASYNFLLSKKQTFEAILRDSTPYNMTIYKMKASVDTTFLTWYIMQRCLLILLTISWTFGVQLKLGLTSTPRNLANRNSVDVSYLFMLMRFIGV